MTIKEDLFRKRNRTGASANQRLRRFVRGKAYQIDAEEIAASNREITRAFKGDFITGTFDEKSDLLRLMELERERIKSDPDIFGGKPIIRGRRMAVEHIISMLKAGDTPDMLLEEYDWLEREDITAAQFHYQKYGDSST